MYSRELILKKATHIFKKKFPHFYKALNEKYPDRWEVFLHRSFIKKNNGIFLKDVFRDTIEYSWNVLIYFPEINITNDNLSHNIKDLYIKINLLTMELSGLRTTFTYNELYKRYVHSHLPGLQECITFTNFCTGSGPINNIHPCSTEEWLFYFNVLENFLSWESIAGRPYKYLHGLFAYTNKININDHKLESLYKDCIKHGLFSKVKYKISNYNIEVLSTDEFEKELTRLVVTTSPSLLSFKTVSGDYVLINNYINYNHRKDDVIKSNNTKKILLFFKNKPITLKIIEDDYSTKINSEDKYPHPSVTKAVINKLSKELTKYKIKRDFIKRKNNLKVAI